MKMIKVLALTALVGTALFAQEAMTQQMIKSEEGLNDIQKGFLYNNAALIRSGVATVKEANELFHNVEATKKYLPEDKMHMGNIAFNAAKRIDAAADELSLYLDANEYSKAQRSFTDIMTACGSCHAVVRGW